MRSLYPRNSEAALSPELFRDPGSEYRAAPFWAWNARLDLDRLTRQIECLAEMGFGGFFMHSRSGLATEYLGGGFMAAVEACVSYAKDRGMRAWLYDEDRWPSGAAGGLVTRDRRHRMRYLVFTPWAYGDPEAPYVEPVNDGRVSAARRENGELLASYEVRLEGGRLASYRRLAPGEEAARGRTWYAYLETATDNPWFNGQAYLDTLNPEAVDAFLAATHERYASRLGREFGETIPAIFTDEPQFCEKQTLGFAEELKDVILPWTGAFASSYAAAYGVDILDALPELFWELPSGKPSLARFRYHDRLAELFARSFADRVGAWCGSHGIRLTGHMMEEPTLFSQTHALGEAMRSLRSFQLPGIDMLCDWREYSTAKQAQSVARQYGDPGVASELYGVTGWHFDFRGHKLQGDWQAALGVTVRVPHLAWLSMRGEAKRDYPAPISQQSPWYREYPLVEDHFARLASALTRGQAATRIAVIHPIESYWLQWGPSEQTSSARDELESGFSNIVSWLLFGLEDFDFLAESLLPEIASIEQPVGAPRFRAGKMAYEAVVVPPCSTLRSTTIALLERFAEAGGRVLFLGEAPGFVDAQPSSAARDLASRGGRVSIAPFSRARLLSELAEFRDLELRKEDGSPHDNVFYQLREDGERRWLFLCHVRHPKNPDIPTEERSTLRIRGAWTLSLWDSAEGTSRPAPAIIRTDISTGGTTTSLVCHWHEHDSLLFLLEPAPRPRSSPNASDERGAPALRTHAAALLEAAGPGRLLAGPVSVSLSEPNVLLLDMAEFRFGDGPWEPREELLRIDNIARARSGWAPREAAMVQPWLDGGTPESRPVSLRFRIESELEVEGCRLALERPEAASIRLNGEPVAIRPEGFFIDEDIATLALPPIPAGASILELSTSIDEREGLEWLYLLGDFGVEASGSRARIVAPVKRLDFGDWTRMGLPFYAGNLAYRFEIAGPGRFALQAAQFRAPLLAASVDGHRVGTIAYSPYVVELGELGPGTHDLELTVFGNRANAFGPVHNCDEAFSWFGPDAWRTRDHRWSYEYRLRPAGILVAPRIFELRA